MSKLQKYSALLILSLSGPALSAQQDPLPPADLGRIVVTARKVNELLEDVPSSVSVLSGEDLEAQGVQTLSDAVGRVPNLYFTEFSARRLSFPYIRGIGSGLGEPSVVTYVDGVPQFSIGSTNLPLLGLERVEFLRGPQGTLYGRNAVGGLIHLIGRQPSAETEIGTSLMMGSDSRFEQTVSFSGPIGENAGLALDSMYSAREGYTENQFTGRLVDGRESFASRALFKYRPSADSELSIRLHAENANDGGFGLGELGSLRSRPHEINQDFEGVTQREVLQPSVTYETVSDDWTLTSISALTTWDALETSDFDFTSIDGVRRRTQEDQEFFYQELRLASHADTDVEAGSGLRWVAGVSGFSSDSNRSAANEFRPGGADIFFPGAQVGEDTNAGAFDDTGFGLFGQVSISPAPRWELTGGLRYDRENKSLDLDHKFENDFGVFEDPTASFDNDFDEVTPMASASYRSSEDRLVYLSAGKAFKAGGFNLTAPEGQQFFGPETSWTYEVGVKQTVVADKLDLKFAAFHVDWDDMQLSLFDATAGGFVENAGESISQGLELELEAALGYGWQAFLGVGLADTEFKQFVDAYGQDVSGNALANAPQQTWDLGLQYRGDLGSGMELFARADYVAVKELYYDPSNIQQESYDLINLSAGLRQGDWRARLFVRNLMDEEYIPVAFQANPADPNFFIGENGAPRHWGVSMGFSF